MTSLPASDIALDQLWEQQSFIGIVAINAAAAFAVVTWEFIQFFPEEGALYDRSKRQEWQSPATWAFILLRYATLASVFTSLFYTVVGSTQCQMAIIIGESCAIAVIACGGVIFSCRVASLWDYQRIILALVFGPCIIMVCSWVAVCTQYKALPSFNLPFGTNCHFEQLPSWTGPLSYATTSLFLLVVLALATIRICTKCTMVAMNTGFTLINRACMVYITIATFSSVVLFIVNCISWGNVKGGTDAVRRASSPYFLVIMMGMATRIYLNLQTHNHTLKLVAESNTFTSSAWLNPDLPNGKGKSNSSLSNMEKGDITPSSSIRIRSPSQAHEPLFEPSITSLSSTRNDIYAETRSMMSGTNTLAGTMSLPTSPAATVTSFATARSQRSRSNSMRGPPPSPSARSHRSGFSQPSSPRSHRVRVKKVGSASMRSFQSTLKEENLKSTWHGV
ncbi:hypothetical protein CVT24_012042 [Panaeolus cyanescens]|uniref:Uncharacterized protein n=1 Tax=Panaeolus cyanescens TaxID=181874 RepID=A0A409VYI0_9AGAR|nr:hypothetical protein CVT24_012042 [Panaeolus cyanescens]